MSVWDSYNSRLDAKGGSVRGARLQREIAYISRKLPSSLSYHTLIVNGIQQQVAVLNSDILEQKTIISLPGEDLIRGSLIEWGDSHWLIVREDMNKEIYTKAIMLQCNYLLKWIALNDSGVPEIHERWCIVSDGTRFMTGETSSMHNDKRMSLGDTRLVMIISRDDETVKFGRRNRFIIDDYGTPNPMAYRSSKPLKLNGVYNGVGVMNFVLTEVNTEDTDHLELHIADYYNYFSPDGTPLENPTNPPDPSEYIDDENGDGSENTTDEERTVWL